MASILDLELIVIAAVAVTTRYWVIDLFIRLMVKEFLENLEDSIIVRSFVIKEHHLSTTTTTVATTITASTLFIVNLTKSVYCASTVYSMTFLIKL